MLSAAVRGRGVVGFEKGVQLRVSGWTTGVGMYSGDEESELARARAER